MNWHGLTTQERDVLVRSCGACGRRRDKAVLVIDHDHATGLVRGALCVRCNDLLGVIHDDADLLFGLYSYITNPPAPGLLGRRHYIPGSLGEAGHDG